MAIGYLACYHPMPIRATPEDWLLQIAAVPGRSGTGIISVTASVSALEADHCAIYHPYAAWPWTVLGWCG